jgi:hypothetical protein
LLTTDDTDFTDGDGKRATGVAEPTGATSVTEPLNPCNLCNLWFFPSPPPS